MVEFRDGDLARLRMRTPFWDRRGRNEGQWNYFPAGQMVRIFRIDDLDRSQKIFVETLSTNYESSVVAEDLVELSPLEQLAEQAD